MTACVDRGAGRVDAPQRQAEPAEIPARSGLAVPGGGDRAQRLRRRRAAAAAAPGPPRRQSRQAAQRRPAAASARPAAWPRAPAAGRLVHARLADPPRPDCRLHRDRLRAPRSRPVRCAEAAPQTPPGAAAQVWRAADAGAGCGIAGAPQRPDPLRQAGSRALSHLSGCGAVPARAGGAGGVGGTGATRPARQTAPAAAADLHRPGAVRTAGDQRICQEMGGGVAVQEPQTRLWPEGCVAAVASGADALGHRTGGRICDPADAGLHRPGAPGRSGPARPLACARHPHRRADPGRHRPDFTRGRAVGLHRGDLGKNRRRGIKHKRIVSAARRQSRVSHPNAAIIVPVTWRQFGATKKKCRLETTVSLLSTIILARLLMPADFGLVALATTILAGLQALSELSFDIALIQNSRAGRPEYDSAWTLSACRNILIAIGLTVAAGPIASGFDDPRLEAIIYCLAVSTLLDGFQNIGIVDFRKELKFHQDLVFRVLGKLGPFLVTVPLAFLWRNYWALVIGTVAGSVFRVILSYAMHSYRPRISFAEWRHLIHFSKWLMLANLCIFISSRAITFIISAICAIDAAKQSDGRMTGEPLAGTFMVVLPWEPVARGGVNQVVLNLCEEIRQTGPFSPLILVTDWRSLHLQEQEMQGFRTVWLRLRAPGIGSAFLRSFFIYMLTFPSALYRWRRLITRYDVRVVNGHFPSLQMLNVALLRLLGLYRGSLLLSFHGTDAVMVLAARGMERVLWRWLFRRTDATIVCSDAIGDRLKNSTPA